LYFRAVVPDIAVEALGSYLKVRGEGSNEKVFLSRNRKGMYVTTVRLAVHKYLKKAGIRKGAVHTLRHTFGTYKSLNGVPPKILQGIMGHKKLESTLLYVHLVDTEVRAYQTSTHRCNSPFCKTFIIKISGIQSVKLYNGC
jgi:site-specific recombinase XerD